MLNIAKIFEMAIESLECRDPVLSVPLAPLVVLASQQDVINHLDHALKHYFPISLDASYLQHSSIGSPYKKWAKFTNEDFAEFDYAFWLLMQNTSRLWHERFNRLLYGIKGSRSYQDLDSIKDGSGIFTGLICERKYKGAYIGIAVKRGCVVDKWYIRWLKYGPSISCQRYDITHREILRSIAEPMMEELSALRRLHASYKELCRDYIATVDILEDHTHIYEGYWTINTPNKAVRWPS